MICMIFVFLYISQVGLNIQKTYLIVFRNYLNYFILFESLLLIIYHKSFFIQFNASTSINAVSQMFCCEF